jgi:hypothetical protein
VRFATADVMRNPLAVGDTILAALAGKTRNHRGSPPPSPASLGGFASNSATLLARGRVPPDADGGEA